MNGCNVKADMILSITPCFSQHHAMKLSQLIEVTLASCGTDTLYTTKTLTLSAEQLLLTLLETRSSNCSFGQKNF